MTQFASDASNRVKSPNDGVKNWCDKHWAPFREGVVAGKVNGILASIRLMQNTVENEEFYEIAQKYSVPGQKPGPEELNWALKKTAPQCCFLGDTTMIRILTESTRPTTGDPR